MKQGADDALERVRRRCAEVARRSTHVRVVSERIEAYAKALAVENLDSPALAPTSHYLGEGGATLAFILTLDSINFGSGYFPWLRKRPGMSGYFTVATALTEHFRREGPWEAAELLALTPKRCAEVFGQEMEQPPVAELMTLFARALNDLGRFLQDRHRGSFRQFVEHARGEAATLVAELIRMPLFNDVARYNGLEVPFYKRAQLTAADLSLAFEGRGAGAFHDLDRLTIFADNLVPHVLRCDGILEYDAALAQAVNAQQLIPAGSPQEVEIRACAVHAAELLAEALRGQGHDASPMRLDYVLWNRGQGEHYKARPRHRTRTPYY
ncbi:MAG: queuosine salvage family protein [Candidatus Bipolaricaulota bacterium]